jgi:hypothetical protein
LLKEKEAIDYGTIRISKSYGTTKSQFDLKEFKKEHPKLVQQYTKDIMVKPVTKITVRKVEEDE